MQDEGSGEGGEALGRVGDGARRGRRVRHGGGKVTVGGEGGKEDEARRRRRRTEDGKKAKEGKR